MHSHKQSFYNTAWHVVGTLILATTTIVDVVTAMRMSGMVAGGGATFPRVVGKAFLRMRHWNKTE